MKYLITLNFILFSLLAHTSNLTAVQKTQINLCIQAYKSNLEQYCNEKNNDGKATLRGSLLYLFHSPASDFHIKDYDQLDEDGRSIEPFTDYIRNIDQKYGFKFTIEFTKGALIDCVNLIDGQIGIYSLEKNIYYNGSKNTFSEIILISLPHDESDYKSYKISEVISSANFKNTNSQCSGGIDVSSEEADYLVKKSTADRLFFEEKNYAAALKLYEFLSRAHANDTYVKKKIDECKTHFNGDNYLTTANTFFVQNDFGNAENWFRKFLAEYPNDLRKRSIERKLIEIENAILNRNYKINIEKADNAYQANNLSNARDYYEQALRLKPNDEYARSRFELTQIEDDKLATAEINRVIQLASSSGKFYGEYFKVLMKYEGYGNHTRLGAKQYYNMVLLLNNYDGRVMNEMHFSRKDCRAYCRIYCKKLNDLYYDEPDTNMKEDIRHLLDNVINNRNQN